MSFTSCGRCPDEDPAHLLHRHPLFLLPQQAGHRPVRHAGKGQAVRPQDCGVFRAGGKGIRLSGSHSGDRCQSHPRDAGRYLPGLLLVPHQRLLQEYLRRQIREITFSPIQEAAVQEMILHGGLFVLFCFCGLHRYIDPGGDTGGPGILLAQPAELLAHMSGH